MENSLYSVNVGDEVMVYRSGMARIWFVVKVTKEAFFAGREIDTEVPVKFSKKTGQELGGSNYRFAIRSSANVLTPELKEEFLTENLKNELKGEIVGKLDFIRSKIRHMGVEQLKALSVALGE